jgi:two-component system, OmpR family, response regulator MtrA
VHIRRLRRKIEANPNEPALVLTVRGVGYKVGKNA